MAEALRQQQLDKCGCGTPVLCIIIFAVIMLFSSCITKTKVEYRDRVVDHYITNTVHDTLVDKITDSVYVNIFTRGDTVFQIKYKEKTRWRDKIVETHDTCWRDSIVTINKEITKEITKIPKIFKISIVLSVLVIIFGLVKLIRWLKTI